MPGDETPHYTHVLSDKAVRWGIDTLGAQRIHPTFVMYLYLRRQERADKLRKASPGDDELRSLVRMDGNPARSYYNPLTDRGNRVDGPLPTFWKNDNLAGSWSPVSIGRQPAARWLSPDSHRYSMPSEHAALALERLLYNKPVAALAMGAYFLRNDGFVISGAPADADVIDALRLRFDYPDDSATEFVSLFDITYRPTTTFDWFTSVVNETDPIQTHKAVTDNA